MTTFKIFPLQTNIKNFFFLQNYRPNFKVWYRTYFVLGSRDVQCIQIKDKKNLKPQKREGDFQCISLYQRDGITIVCESVFIDLNCFSGESFGPWASCLSLMVEI